MPLSIQSRPDKEHAEAVIVAAVEAGMEFIDTANCYCIDNTDFGHNERLISTAMRNLLNGAQVTIATKGGFTRPGGRWETDGRPESLRRVCEQSLRDLVDLFRCESIMLKSHWVVMD